jgi:glycosyltransferase involved in cell wall biosynthesis
MMTKFTKMFLTLKSHLKKTPSNNSKRAAHFLLIPELLYSPPNNAIINAYLESGYSVDIFSPGKLDSLTNYGPMVRTYIASYTWLWICKNIISTRWLKYKWISGTSEDPLAIVGIISFVYIKKSFVLVDEIKAGSYRGDRSHKWKSICRWSIKRADFKIVNDNHRINLLADYANLNHNDKIIVYPGCYHERPKVDLDSFLIKKDWGFPRDAFVIGSSGGFNLTAGADWLITAVTELNSIFAVIQPLGVSPLSMFLMERLEINKRLFIQKTRLGWYEAWKNSIGFDIGLSIYTNPAPQFQNMGISSNRLCMFIAMGVPVIASKQESFDFLEEYDCGILVSSYVEFKLAIQEIQRRHTVMRNNCEKCFYDYIQSRARYQKLLELLSHSKSDSK